MRTFLSVLLLTYAHFQGLAVTKIACIGASITYGATIDQREKYSFPGQLQTLLGSSYLVENYGVGSTTLLKKGDYPYVKTGAYQQALHSNPDVVFIDLGGNDAKLVNRKYLDTYERDYHELIQSFAALPSHPRIVIMLPMVSFVKDTTGIWDPVITNRIAPMARRVAFYTGLEVLDIHQLLMDKPELVPDLIHPNAEGSGIIAKRMYELLTQKKDPGFDIFSQLGLAVSIDSFNGYACGTFKFRGRECKIVKPKWSAIGHPYIWRARFWGHEPQTDVALLERGFHVVYCDAAELLGNAEE